MPMSMAEIERNLVALRLPGMKETLETRALQANQGDEPFMEIFAYLVQDEIDYRRSRLVERRYKASGLDDRKILEDFDWSFNPKLPKKEIPDNAADDLLDIILNRYSKRKRNNQLKSSIAIILTTSIDQVGDYQVAIRGFSS